MKGLYVAIEGIDGSGKSEVANRLGKRTYPIETAGNKPLFVRQPGGSPFSERHRHACLNEDLHVKTQTLFYSSLISNTLINVVKPHLDQNGVVISDRGFGTTLAYQGIACNNVPMVTNIIGSLGEDAPVADLTIYLTIPLAIAIARQRAPGRTFDRFEESSMVEKQKIKESYDFLFNARMETSIVDKHGFSPEYLRKKVTKSLVIVDATRPIDEVVAKCYGHIIRAITGINKEQS